MTLRAAQSEVTTAAKAALAAAPRKRVTAQAWLAAVKVAPQQLAEPRALESPGAMLARRRLVAAATRAARLARLVRPARAAAPMVALPARLAHCAPFR